MAAAAVALGLLQPHQNNRRGQQPQPHQQAMELQPPAAGGGGGGPGQGGGASPSASSTSSGCSAASSRGGGGDGGTPKKKPKTFQQYLPEGARTYSCTHCRANLANHAELISKSFQGSQGKAYLFNAVVNIVCGQAEERVLLTGLHAVADIKCACCKTTLGWKYEHAYETSQKYKEGKYIIELVHMIKDNGWDVASESTRRKRFKRSSLG